jgi:fructose-bisphosphate aldolase class I
VPSEVPGIVFLSGGQTPEEATARLDEIVKMAKKQNAPWRITFSYSRALQDPVLKTWRGDDKNVSVAQQIFAKRVQETSLASEGQYK